MPASLPQATPGALNVPVNIDRTVPVSLSDPELDGGSELMGAQAAPKGEPTSPGEKLAVQGVAPKAPPGRVDDFSWPPKKPPAGQRDDFGGQAVGRTGLSVRPSRLAREGPDHLPDEARARTSG